MASQPALKTIDARQQPRDEVHYRARGFTATRERLPLHVVNTSVGGFMARTEAEHQSGERVSVMLPVIGEVDATIRWALGGRIGCQFDHLIEPLVYRAMLTALQR
jgi:hypothetical protein